MHAMSQGDDDDADDDADDDSKFGGKNATKNLRATYIPAR